MNKNKLVSIVCITFNQEKYIAQCLDGLVMQKTDFPLEILVHDDASTDSTSKIILGYKKKHPDLFKVTIERENRFSKDGFSFIGEMFKDAKGQYIALCEGDDFWTDPNKLQLQFNFLEKNLDYALCFHPVKVFFENAEQKSAIYPAISDKSKFTIKNLIQTNFIQTNSVMYRKQKYDDLVSDVMPADWYLHLYHARFGRIGFLNKVMSAYRKHQQGLWWESDKPNDTFLAKNWREIALLYKKMLTLFDEKDKTIKKIIYSNITGLFCVLIEVGKRNKSDIFKLSMEEFPEFSYRGFLNYLKKIEENNEKEKNLLREKDAWIAHLEKDVSTLNDEIRRLGEELQTIGARRNKISLILNKVRRRK